MCSSIVSVCVVGWRGYLKKKLRQHFNNIRIQYKFVISFYRAKRARRTCWILRSQNAHNWVWVTLHYWRQMIFSLFHRAIFWFSKKKSNEFCSRKNPCPPPPPHIKWTVPNSDLLVQFLTATSSLFCLVTGNNACTVSSSILYTPKMAWAMGVRNKNYLWSIIVSSFSDRETIQSGSPVW